MADRTVHPDRPEEDEDAFRYQVRDILGLSWNTRDIQIFDHLKRLVREHDEARMRLDTSRLG